MRRYLIMTGAALSSAILYFLPFHRPGLFFLSFLALLPVLFILPVLKGRESFLVGMLMGNVIFWGIGSWLLGPMLEFGGVPLPLAILALEAAFLFLSIYYGIILYLLHYLTGKGISLALAAPLTWASGEFLRSFFTFKFPFGFWGYALAYHPHLIQPASFVGVFGVSALIVLANVGLFYLASALFPISIPAAVYDDDRERKPKPGMTFRGRLPGSILILLLVITIFFIPQLGMGRDTIRSLRAGEDVLRLGLIQNNVPQWKKWDYHYRDEILQNTISLSKEVAAYEPDLIIWPESSLPFDLVQNSVYARKLRLGWQGMDSWLLAGSLAHGGSGGAIYNSMFLLDRTGKVAQRYNKLSLVPFGEYNPLPILQRFIQINLEDLQPGNRAVSFTYQGWQWRTPICYEVLEAGLTRRLAEGVDFLITTSNEAWYGKSSVPSQMLAATIFRAVENGIPVVRVANTSSSAVVDARGRIRRLLPAYQAAAEYYPFALPRRETFYQNHGMLAGYILLSFPLLLLVTARLRKIQES